MKKIILLALPFLMLLSCKKNEKGVSDSLVNNKNQAYTAESAASVYKYLTGLGYKSDEIHDEGDKYVVDGDILYAKNNPPNISKPAGPTTEQYSTSNIVGYDVQPNIILKIDQSKFDWWDEIHAAADAWNAIPNSRIHFNVVTDQSVSTYDIIVINTSNLPNYCSGAYAPMNGKPGAQIDIVNGNLVTASFAYKKSIIMHELGHTIGFRNTNWKSLGQSQAMTSGNGAYMDAMHILGTPTGDDANSIMNGSTCPEAHNDFSPYDIVATQFLYPSNPPATGTVPVFRYYSRSTSHDHFYTTDFSTLGNGSNSGYIFEGIGFFAFPGQASGTVPVYGYYSSSKQDHFYTPNYSELGGGSQGYSYEGIKFYAYTSAQNGSVPVYSYWSVSKADHFYTKNTDEFAVNGAQGYTNEGIKFYAY